MSLRRRSSFDDLGQVATTSTDQDDGSEEGPVAQIQIEGAPALDPLEQLGCVSAQTLSIYISVAWLLITIGISTLCIVWSVVYGEQAKDCENMLATWLLVYGITSIVGQAPKTLESLLTIKFGEPVPNKPNQRRCTGALGKLCALLKAVVGVCTCFQMIWIILGSAWTFMITAHGAAAQDKCGPVYTFCFYFIVISVSMFVSICCFATHIVCCSLVLAALISAANR
eukprot:NODE_3599_length_906_cov_23.248541_g2995_i0.p1 GENE.NODE_3599_length_906_cov_23.248541_g2995_i0~~NODE_3599_length_906_cov_23.248541_g2995_i0.p1  ORF type:complete len:226 (+),score=26.80 NODE_3599_length_906_cov_23.248541_g2995_i0:216-893(+)